MRARLTWLLGLAARIGGAAGAWTAPRRAGLVLAAVLIAVGLLVVPVPPVVLDVLLGANLLLSVGLLVAAVRAGEPRRLPQFPVLLVLAILVRLGLNVAAVRLILTAGYAGRVVDAFGTWVVRGDYLVGAVVFAILATVQYLVLARGGERMAEVAARFVLDALPGRQAAIEADLRTGAISLREAQARREALDREAQIYGAMDGALRLVKGDVVAGLLILGTGLVAGLAVGVMGQDLSLAEAAQRYALLTLGDGLVTQVPVLLGAAGAGLLLSRGAAQVPADADPDGTDADTDAAASRTAAGIEVEADAALGLTDGALAAAVRGLSVQLGVPLPRPRLVQADAGAPGAVRIRLFGAPLTELAIDPGAPGEPGEPPLPAIVAALEGAAPELLTLDQVQKLLESLQVRQPALVRETVPRRIDVARLTALLRRLLAERVWPIDVRAVLEALAGLPALEADLGALVEQARGSLGRFLVGGYVRGASAAGDGGLPALVLDAEIEALLREAQRGGHGPGRPGRDAEALAIEPDLVDDIVQSVLAAKEQAPGAVLLCHGDVRRPVQRLLARAPRALPVFSYGELPPSLPVVVLGRVEPGGPPPGRPGKSALT